ncbi:MAG TPA: RyR domain-containing protein [Bryobacteraceae bacterium]|nr:RyR domain-containing protein [Bryobacteraceae bacterium]
MARRYLPHPLPVDNAELEDDLLQLIEGLAENAHNVWALQRLSEGWAYGPERSDERKEHPCLVPYSDLPENEKVYDRNAVTSTIRGILALGFVIRRP